MKLSREKTTKIIIKTIMILILSLLIMNCGSCTANKQSYRFNKCGTKQAKQAKKHYNFLQYQ